MNKWKISIFILVVGTLVSSLGGWFASYHLSREISLLTGLILECVTLILATGARLIEVEHTLSKQLEIANESVKLSKAIASSDEPILTELYMDLLFRQKELSEGKYELKTLEAVYEDDKRSIGHLQRNEVLRSMCPVAQTESEITTQFENKSFINTIDAHFSAVARGVKVIRIYTFVNVSLFELDICQKHLHDLSKSGVECRYIFLDDPAYDQAKQIDADFIVFDDKKVSIGTIDPVTGTVKAARVNSDKQTVQKYKREFEKLAGIATEYKTKSKFV